MTSPLDYSKKASRDYSLDWIAGLLTVVVILLHIEIFTDYCLGFWKVWGERVLYFFMAWFFYKSGMFEKEYSFSTTWRKVWRTLIVPYLFFSIIAWIIWIPQYFYSNESVLLLFKITISRFIDLNIIPGNNPMWFLVGLAGCRLIYPWAKKLVGNNYIISLIGFGTAYCYHLVYVDVTHKYFMLGIAQSCVAMAFYALGAELRYKQYSKRLFCLSSIVYIIAVILFPPIINFAYAGSISSELSWACSLPLCIAGIITWNNIIRMCPAKFFKICNLGYIGRNSMTYYSAHWSIIITLSFLYHEGGPKILGLPLQWAMVVSCVVILPVADILLRRYLPWAVGVKGRVRKGVEVGAATDPLP